MNRKIIITLLISFQFILAQTEISQTYIDNSLESTWLKKEISDSKILDDAETLINWEQGGLAKMTLCNSKVKEGDNSIKLLSPTESNGASNYPIAYIEKKINNENWEEYNRIAVWIYAKQKNTKFFYISLELKNKGKVKVPNKFGRTGKHFVELKTNKWNRVYWEIPSLPRDKVTGLSVVYTIKGKSFKGVGDSVAIYIDKLELQKVKTDYDNGWKVAEGAVAFCHNGYFPSSEKIALVSDIKDSQFSIINSLTNKVVLTKEIRVESTRFGNFQYLDFSELKTEGKYKISVGNIVTKPFQISNNIWEESIWKNLNFWKLERCGQSVKGIHDNCHRDVYVEHEGKKNIVNGGWHDAGDLTQMIYNTGDAVVAMLKVADKVETTNPKLYNALVNEAKWGLEWMLKTRFGKGYRHNFGAISKYTDGIIGTEDDIVFKAKNLSYENFISAMVISQAALFFENRDRALSDHCRDIAIEDWTYALKGISVLNVELCGKAIIASINLFKLTSDTLYLTMAIKWADVLLKSQQQEYPNWDIPLTGFYYKDMSKKQILRYNPIGDDQAPIIALKNICELLPNHPKWIEWYASIVLYAEYIKESSKLANPFEMIPHSIYNIDEIHKPSVYGFQQSTLAKYNKYEKERPQYKEQVKNGLPLGKGYYLRTFPVWYGHRGSLGIQLSQTKALVIASQLRNDSSGVVLAEKQLEWVMGRNPFAQSLIYGEGYNYPPLYSVSSGPIVGALPCGIQTNGNSDIPNWPATTLYNYKEIWAHPTNRWLWLMEDFNGSAIISEKESKVDLVKLIDFSIQEKNSSKSEFEINISAMGIGTTKFEIRGFNLSIEESVKIVELKDNISHVLSWRINVVSNKKPWIAVIIINDDLSTKQEITSYGSR